jgi:predicted nuclease of predicted toxin-antitoxin system
VKVLLDENMPHRLRLHLRGHETTTAAHMGWAGWSNGELLDAAQQAGFDVLVTGDLSLQFQQNLKTREIAIVSLSANNWPLAERAALRSFRG